MAKSRWKMGIKRLKSAAAAPKIRAPTSKAEALLMIKKVTEQGRSRRRERHAGTSRGSERKSLKKKALKGSRKALQNLERPSKKGRKKGG
jgi:hypothetical protein